MGGELHFWWSSEGIQYADTFDDNVPAYDLISAPRVCQRLKRDCELYSLDIYLRVSVARPRDMDNIE